MSEKMPNLKKKYQDEVAPALMQKFGYKSPMQIPRLDKIVVNCGCGEARDNSKVLEAVVSDLTTITGQKAIITTKAKKSSSPTFKLREGMIIGARSTLRGDRMWEFLDRCSMWPAPCPQISAGSNPTPLTAAATTPMGNQGTAHFPEIEVRQDRQDRGMDIVITTTARTDEEAKELLTLVGAPFATK
jgi:large subunit ribosomal protein L5